VIVVNLARRFEGCGARVGMTGCFLSSLIGLAVVDGRDVRACSYGSLDSFKVGQSMMNVVASFGGCGGDVMMDRDVGR